MLFDLKYIKPTQLFLLDAVGALCSSLLLGFVLVYFQEYIGMPLATLYLLAGLAFLFFIYSLSCFIWKRDNWPIWMRIIAVVNSLYCLLTLLLCLMHAANLSIWGWGYFVGEMIIVLALAALEWKRAGLGDD
jgi:hypothetical protein